MGLLQTLERLHVLEQKVRLLEKRLNQGLERASSEKKRIYSAILNKHVETPFDPNFLMGNLNYIDLTPLQAWELYQSTNLSFVLLDVTREGFNPPCNLPERHHIPLEKLHQWSAPMNGDPIMVISERGVRSILACEALAERGFLNCHNISGGYDHLPFEKEQSA